MQLRKKLVSVIPVLAVAGLLFSGSVGPAAVAGQPQVNTMQASPGIIETDRPGSGEISLMYLEDDKNSAILYCNNFAANRGYGAVTHRDIEAAVGRNYRGGVSVYAEYEYGKCHVIVRYGKVLHGPHQRGL